MKRAPRPSSGNILQSYDIWSPVLVGDKGASNIQVPVPRLSEPLLDKCAPALVSFGVAHSHSRQAEQQAWLLNKLFYFSSSAAIPRLSSHSLSQVPTHLKITRGAPWNSGSSALIEDLQNSRGIWGFGIKFLLLLTTTDSRLIKTLN